MRNNTGFGTFEEAVSFESFADARNFIMEARLIWNRDLLGGINLLKDVEYIVFLAFNICPDEDLFKSLVETHNGNILEDMTEEDMLEIIQNNGAVSVGDASLMMFVCRSVSNYEPIIKEILTKAKNGMTVGQIARKLKLTVNVAYPALFKLEKEGKINRKMMYPDSGSVFFWIKPETDACEYIG